MLQLWSAHQSVLHLARSQSTTASLCVMHGCSAWATPRYVMHQCAISSCSILAGQAVLQLCWSGGQAIRADTRRDQGQVLQIRLHAALGSGS